MLRIRFFKIYAFLIFGLCLISCNFKRANSVSPDEYVINDFSSEVVSISYSPDGKTFATASNDSNVVICDILTKKQVRKIKTKYDTLSCVTYNPDTSMLVIGSMEHGGMVMDPKSEKIICALEGDTHTSNLSVSTDGKYIAGSSISLINSVIIWDASTGKKIRTCLYDGPVHAVAFSPDGRKLVTGDAKGTLTVRDTMSWNILSTVRLHTDEINCLAFSPDSSKVCTGSYDGNIKIYDISNNMEILDIKQPEGSIRAVAFSHDGKKIASTENFTVKIFNAHNGQVTSESDAHIGLIHSISFSLNDSVMTVGGTKKCAIISVIKIDLPHK